MIFADALSPEWKATGQLNADLNPAFRGTVYMGDVALEVQTDGGYHIYEIKTAILPRDCVREAMGQVLEYAYWPGSPAISGLWVVGPSEIDSTTGDFVAELQKRFGLPIDYLHQPIDENTKSE